MNGFEFVFSLFGLLLGLALAEGLGGLSRAIKASHKVRIGWPTALLGLFVSCDVVTFWMYGWSLRDRLPLTWPVLFGGFVVTGTYYVAASLVFPNEPEEWSDLDGHFDKHATKVFAGMLFCNLALLATSAAIFALPALNLRNAVVAWSFFPVVGIAALVREHRVRIGCMLWLIALYPLSVVW